MNITTRRSFFFYKRKTCGLFIYIVDPLHLVWFIFRYKCLRKTWLFHLGRWRYVLWLWAMLNLYENLYWLGWKNALEKCKSYSAIEKYFYNKTQICSRNKMTIYTLQIVLYVNMFLIPLPNFFSLNELIYTCN